MYCGPWGPMQWRFRFSFLAPPKYSFRFRLRRGNRIGLVAEFFAVGIRPGRSSWGDMPQVDFLLQTRSLMKPLLTDFKSSNLRDLTKGARHGPLHALTEVQSRAPFAVLGTDHSYGIWALNFREGFARGFSRFRC